MVSGEGSGTTSGTIFDVSSWSKTFFISVACLVQRLGEEDHCVVLHVVVVRRVVVKALTRSAALLQRRSLLTYAHRG